MVTGHRPFPSNGLSDNGFVQILVYHTVNLPHIRLNNLAEFLGMAMNRLDNGFVF